MIKLLRGAALAAVVLLAAGGVLYLFFGLRVVMTGGGMPALRFVRSSSEQEAIVERHRAAQRADAQARGLGSDVSAPPASAPGEAAGAARPEGVDASNTAATTGSVPPGLPAPASSAASVVASSRGSAPGYWTDFRGPQRDGVYRERPVVVDWPAGGLMPLWKQPAGAGYASFVVAGGRAFTIEQRGAREVVAAYDVLTGRELWTNAWDTEFRESMGGDGPRATPTWADGLVFALGAIGELRALDEATGRVVWRTNILTDSRASNINWGMAGAPLVVDDTLVVVPGGRNGQSVVAYDRRTGKRAWAALDDQAAYASPMLATLGGVRQIVLFTASRVLGLATDGSRVLWAHPWPGPNDINAAQPLVVSENRLFISSGYGVGGALLELTPSADGFTVREVWRNTRMKNRFASAVLHDGIIYGLDEAILAAVDAATGELVWKGGRYGYGQLILASDHLIVLTEDGDLALVRATRERFNEVARFPVLEGKTWNVPALTGGYLLVRNLAEMAAFDLRPRASVETGR
jgi:outer membrane protein assembly factor BamB